MDQNELVEERQDNSGFIQEYVAAHRQELEDLRARATAKNFDGQWYIIGDKEYPAKRLQYATTSFDERLVSPRIILYPAQGSGDEDIRKAIALCRELGMAIALRTGGHQYCGYSSTPPENMQIDLSQTYPDYAYDAETNVLRCGVSHALREWATKNQDNGIYLPMGVCGWVHLGGHVHTGGWGMVARSHGILADHVLAFDIILASGDKEHIVRPEKGKTSQHNDDLYYAVLGGGRGGDFGIVTHWEFRPLRDADYPNSACYAFTWFWSKEKMQGVVRRMAELSRLCANGEVPSDYEFMLTITGLGRMNFLSEPLKAELLQRGHINLLSELAKAELLQRGDINEKTPEALLPMPALIQMWMCFTNKGGAGEAFNDAWFESFTAKEVCGKPLHSFRKRNWPVSDGLANHFIMRQAREMQYPFVKRSRVTMGVPDGFAESYTERMDKIMGWLGTRKGQHLVSQQQIYAGGAVAENAKLGITSYSWREQALAMSHDDFYEVDLGARERAEKWQSDNDEEFIGKGTFSNEDMRMFAYTFGNRDLEEVWRYFYDSEQKYRQLRTIKSAVDPDGLFIVDSFSVRPLSFSVRAGAKS